MSTTSKSKKKAAYNPQTTLDSVKSKKGKDALAKLENEIESNPVCRLTAAHGKLSTRLSPRVAAAWTQCKLDANGKPIVTDLDKDEARTFVGRTAAVLNEAWQGGLFQSETVNGIYAHNSGNAMVSIGATPIGAVLVKALRLTVEQAAKDVKAGKIPACLYFPHVQQTPDKRDVVTWKPSYRLSRMFLKAMDIEPSRDTEEMYAQVRECITANVKGPKGKGAAKGAGKPKARKPKADKPEPQTQLGAELEKLAA